MQPIRDIDLFHERPLLLSMTRGSFALMAVGVGVLAAWLVGGWPHEEIDVPWAALTTLAIVGSSLVHEAIHAAAFKVFGGDDAHVRFGSRAGMLYASSPGLVLPRGRFVAVLLAPTVAVSLACFAVGVVARVPLAGFLVLAMHLSSCAGDLVIAREVLGCPEAAMVEDTECGVRLWRGDPTGR
jgi:hypothetical protein